MEKSHPCEAQSQHTKKNLMKSAESNKFSDNLHGKLVMGYKKKSHCFLFLLNIPDYKICVNTSYQILSQI